MKNGVYVRVFGGLGNQLFIYACGKALSLKKGVPLILDNRSGFLRDKYKRNYKLNDFNIHERKSGLKAFFYLFFRERAPFLSNISMPKVVHFKEKDPRAFQSDILNNKINDFVYLEGYWQSYKYFEGFEDIIRKEFKITKELSSYNQALGKEIKGKNAVAIHIRRVNYDPVLSIDYYMEGIRIMMNRVEKPELYFFSDDIEFCKANFNIDIPVHFIDHNGDDEIADFWLMAQCKHFIIANSSFSWWAAWLADYKNKIVVAPASVHIGVIDNFFPKSWMII